MSATITRRISFLRTSGHYGLRGVVRKLVLDSMLILLFCLFAILTTAGGLIETNIPSCEGFEKAWFASHLLTRTAPGSKPWTAQINTIYIPRTGMTWVGAWTQQNPSVVEDRILSIHPDLGGSPETLRFFVSTNRYALGVTNISVVMQSELADFTNSTRRFHDPQFGVRLEKLLGSAAFRDYYPTNMFFEPTFKNVTRPSKFKGLTVEGTNAVVSLEIGTNILARIAFNKHVVPVWATTNGVSIGPIPTNCVFYSEVISNKVATRVVY